MVDSADVVSSVGSIGTESQMRTPSSLSCSSIAGNSATEAYIASNPGCSRLSRSCSHAPGLADQIHQNLLAELQRSRNRRHRSSSSSGGSSDSPSSQTDSSQSDSRYRRRSPPRPQRPYNRSAFRPPLVPRRFQSYGLPSQTFASRPMLSWNLGQAHSLFTLDETYSATKKFASLTSHLGDNYSPCNLSRSLPLSSPLWGKSLEEDRAQ